LRVLKPYAFSHVGQLSLGELCVPGGEMAFAEVSESFTYRKENSWKAEGY
jgi:hypothetical protein